MSCFEQKTNFSPSPQGLVQIFDDKELRILTVPQALYSDKGGKKLQTHNSGLAE